MEYPKFDVEYEARGQNSWEKRMFAQASLTEDLRHAPEHTVMQYYVDSTTVHFLVEIEDELALSSDYFKRSTDASRE